MGKVFGFNESSAEMAIYSKKANLAIKELEKIGKDMRDDARKNFESVSGTRTGRGVAGIVMERSLQTVRVGWSPRPGLHGYFHELGFHALDNRFKKRHHIRRTSKSRKRIYTKVAATYVPPRPHMRPAFDGRVDEIEDRIQRRITE